MTVRAVDPEVVALTPLQPPSSTGGLLDVFRRRYMLRLLVKRELSARYQGSFLGMLWSYVQPLVRFCMYYFVVGGALGLHDNVQNFAIHVFSGLVVVHYFTETFSAGTRSIVRNKAIVQKMAMPREMFPVASMLVSAYHTVPQLAILIVACVVTGWSPDLAGFGAGLLGLAIITILGTSCALLFSAANVFFRDFSNVVQTLTTFVHFSVPMIYPFSGVAQRFGEQYVSLYLANPLAESVLLIQRCLWTTTTSNPAESAVTDMPPDLFTRGFVMLAICLLFLGFSQIVFSRIENKVPERLSG